MYWLRACTYRLGVREDEKAIEQLQEYYPHHKVILIPGYLIVKEGKVEPFLGCTNFKADKTGCDGFMTREYYEKNVLNKEH